MIDWIIKLYYPKFESKIGFKKETVDLWPALQEAKIIMKKLEFLVPGLTQFVDGKGNIKEKEIVQKLSKKFENDKRTRTNNN